MLSSQRRCSNQQLQRACFVKSWSRRQVGHSGCFPSRTQRRRSTTHTNGSSLRLPSQRRCSNQQLQRHSFAESRNRHQLGHNRHVPSRTQRHHSTPHTNETPPKMPSQHRCLSQQLQRECLDPLWTRHQVGYDNFLPSRTQRRRSTPHTNDKCPMLSSQRRLSNRQLQQA
jgi:hypothetical protein